MKLNVGCGPYHVAGYINVDCQPETKPDVLCDIGRDVWPWPDNSVDEVRAAHVMEHLGGDTFFHCLKEMYRVCRNGALVEVVVPHPRSDSFLGDPTHVRPIMPQTLVMLSRKYCAEGEVLGNRRTPFGEYIGVDFELGPTVKYSFDKDVDPADPELWWKVKHLSNIVMEIHMTLTVHK